MQSIHLVQAAIDYMESRLPEAIDPAALAAHAHMSGFHFHRLFSLLTGMTATAYATSRRLSLAGQALSRGAHVLDVALAHGYETPEGFHKAFTRFHGVTPSMARRGGVTLKRFDPLRISIMLEGGFTMEYRIETLPARTFAVCRRAFDTIKTQAPDNRDIPHFWDACHSDGTLAALASLYADGIFGLCAPAQAQQASFDYGIGVPIAEGQALPGGHGLIRWTIPAQTYAVFQSLGDTPDVIGDTWTQIFRQFLPQSPYEILDAPDFEYYPATHTPGLVCEVWVPIAPKDDKTAE